MYQLYYAPGAASMLVHWLLLELDAPHELHLVDTAAGAQKRPEYLALNPNGVVPTLVHDGVPMHEAAALAMTLADRHPQAGLVPPSESSLRPAYTQWMFHMANAIQPLFRQWWYPHEPAGEAHADAVRALVAPRIEAAWSRIDAHLAAHGPYLLGESAVRGRLLPHDAHALVAQHAKASDAVAAFVHARNDDACASIVPHAVRARRIERMGLTAW